MENNNEERSTGDKLPEICITAEEFDPEKLILEDPQTASFTIGQSKISTTTSDARYLDEEERKCLLYIKAPPQSVFGVSYTFDMTTKDSDQVPENAKGMQIAYPLTSMKTTKNPTPKEKAYQDFLDCLWEKAVEKGRQEAEKEGDDLLIPDVAVNSFLAAEKKKNWALAVKKPAEHPKSQDTKTIDYTKPQRQYVKLITSGKGKTLKALTLFYDSNDIAHNAVKYISKRGIIEPCFLVEGTYYGAHGKNPHGCSLRFKLAEANYTEISGVNGVPSTRMLGKSTSEPVHEEGSDEEGTFGEDPSIKLSKAVKKAPSKKTVPKGSVAKATVKKPVTKTVLKKAVKKTIPKKPVDDEDEE